MNGVRLFSPGKMIRCVSAYFFGNSLFLIIGAVAGVVWANIGPGSYTAFAGVHLPFTQWIDPHGQLGITLRDVTNDLLMAFFFALAGKDIWESMLPGGALRGLRHAATPVVCAIGGMAGPATLYILGAIWLGQFNQVSRGWAIPCATDIAFSYLIARLVFGKAHPATPFLLLLAIADDAMGLAILAVFYPVAPIKPLWLLLPAGAVLLGWAMRRHGVSRFGWYLALPGTMSWIGTALSGLHPALGLLPVIPTLPHARSARPQIRWEASNRRDALDRFEAQFRKPVEVILGLFGILNAGVAVTAVASPTFLVLLGLLLGKPLGIVLSGWLATRILGLRLPAGVGLKELLVLGCAGGIGFTVAVFVAMVAFEPGMYQDAAKMGALSSCLAIPVTVLAAKVVGIRKPSTINAETLT